MSERSNRPKIATCAECRWWEADDERKWGFCWRYPPVVISRSYEFTESLENHRPVTEANEGCGEFSR